MIATILNSIAIIIVALSVIILSIRVRRLGG
jgi:hypothetical protein